MHTIAWTRLGAGGVQGSGVQKTFGKGQATAREAAIVLADYTDKPYELTVAGEV